jgi:hypothetical protein
LTRLNHWELPETEALTFAPFTRFDGKLRVVEPSIGTLMSNNDVIEVIINSPGMKVTNENRGFL